MRRDIRRWRAVEEENFDECRTKNEASTGKMDSNRDEAFFET